MRVTRPIDAGADPNATRPLELGLTPLWCALPPSPEKLLDMGPAIVIPWESDAAFVKRCALVMGLLAEKGADVSSRCNGQSLIDLASRYGYARPHALRNDAKGASQECCFGHCSSSQTTFRTVYLGQISIEGQSDGPTKEG
jgi:hypothetical protein